ncbi:MAG: ABC transporter ATP-binding protein [Proteobacteria bacterium]|nr:ABC transporter ATP-binding protein [Pseudomonadota bacterium]
MSLHLDRIHVKYKNQPILYETDLKFEANSFNILLGATGAGKTSLIRLIAGLDTPTKGRILFNGKDVTNLHVRKRNNSVVYQQFINYPSMNVFDNIASSLKMKGLPKDEITEKVEKVMDTLQISRFRKRKPDELSGGQQQRLAIARALVKDSDIILLDEPLVNLDYKLREDLRNEIREIFKQKGTIVFYATTEPEEPLLLGGKVVVMEEGRVLQYGPTREVYDHPNHINVGRIFSYPKMNMAECELKEGFLQITPNLKVKASERFKDITPGKYIMGVRAHHLILSSENSERSLELEVNLAEINGSDTLVHLNNGKSIEWIMHLDRIYNFSLQQKVQVDIKENSIFLFDDSGKLLSSPNQ